MTESHDRNDLDGIAIIGMSGRFPGAKNVAQFWQNLVNGMETISRFREDELEFSVSSPEAIAEGQTFIRARAILEDVDQFDAAFFGIYPREAEVMDPQHRLFLECAWEALEEGGYDPDRYPGLIGVYAGVSLNTYLLYNLCANRAYAANFAGNYQVGFYQVMLGNDKDFMPTRLSYKLNLKGPSMSIQTACSTSLVAVCQACTSLLNYQCDMALAGGASITFPQKRDYLYQEGGMVSADGFCRVFDADARGTVFGHGVAVVLLKRLADALADGDPVLAVIKGTAVNNDGSAKIGYAAPSVTAQAEVIAMAQAAAGVTPDTVSYIEAHGTGTPLGDPIEIAALTQAFRAGGAHQNGFCAIGTGKTHIGHLDVASGVTGLIKTILQLQHGVIPPLLHFRSPNPEIDFAKSPFFPVTKLLEWKPGESPRRAGISAFGVGGTNAHVVVEEAPPHFPVGPSRPQQLLLLSAKTPGALQTMTANLATHLDEHPDKDLSDVAFTLQRGRKAFSHRRAIAASTPKEAVMRLRSLDPRSTCTGMAADQEPSAVFMFPGQGVQYLQMGRELYLGEAVFREAMDQCAEILRHSLDLDLRTVLYPDTAEAAGSAEMQINETWLAQPAIFAVEYALARLWMSWGVKPAVLIGHSIGEYVGAVLAETFTLDDALGLLSVRARLMQALPAGSMLSVRMDAGEVEAILPEGVSIAAVNSPMLCVVSGPTEILKEFQRGLESKGIATRFLHTSHAFHSAMIDPMLPEFASAARQTPHQPPKLPWVSTCTGHWMNPEDLAEGGYWVRQIRHPVRFAQALDAVIGDPQHILLEVGPGQTLSQLARQHGKKPENVRVVASLAPVAGPNQDLDSMLAALGRLWVSGARVDWEGFSGTEKRRRVPLPTYPFERKRYWIEPVPVDAPTPQTATVAAHATDIELAKEPQMQTTPVSSATAVPSRKERLLNELRDLFKDYSGADHSQTDENATFIDLGFDSLFLTQASQGVLKRFGVKVTFRQMLGDLSTLSSLAAFLDGKLPPEALPQIVTPVEPAKASPSVSAKPSAVTPLVPSQSSQVPTSAGGNLMETVIQQQMAIMAQQLELLRQAGTPQRTLPGFVRSEAPPAAPSDKPVITAVKMDKESHFGPFKPIEKGATGGLTARQQAALKTLVARYNRRTAKSKALSQEHRAHFCDPRAAGNFRQLWKEMVYPILCTRSRGSRIWDIDGNEYIDVTMGFGANYLGHSPEFVMQALEAQMKLGVEIGPQSPIAGEVAKMLCEFTGMERATFCNTGSEAVMAAIRVARTVTGREKIVYFYGDYHGIFDEVLGRPALVNDMPGAMPIAPGIPHLTNVMILEYGSPSALDAIRNHAGEIAAVLVEPVQSRHPDLQPREFLHELRRLTEDKDIALIFDEVITGFRVAPGGAQEYIGVKADLATYGKVVGGGMPIGVLAGSSAYMDALDGGFWQYGDDSSPPAGVTFFAGTFVRHPLAMAAAYAVMKHLKSSGPALQERANQVTARFVQRANAFFQGRQLPLRLQTFSAMFFYDFHPDLKFASLLFYYLRDRGIHIWEGRVGHLSIAHTDEDMDRVLLAFEESVEEMQSGGFLPEAASPAVMTMGPSTPSAKAHGPSDPFRFPLAQAQREMWIGAQMRPEAAGPHHACTGLYLDGDLDIESLKRAIFAVVERHEGLRCTFSEDGTEAILHPAMVPEIPVHDLSSLPEPEREAGVNEILHQEGRRLLDLTNGPLVQFQILKLSPQRHLMIFTAQMIVCDGWSHYVVFEDLGTFYTAFVRGTEPLLKPLVPMHEYARWEQANSETEEANECEAFWRSQFETVPPPFNLPTARPRPPTRTFEGDRREVTLPPDLYRKIKQLAKEQKNSYFAVLLAAFQVWLYRLGDACDLVVGVPFAAQGPLDMETLVGQCANILPLRIRLDPDEAFSNVLRKTWASVLDAQENWNFSFVRLISGLDLPSDPSRIPLVSILFNIDPPMAKVKFGGLGHRFVTGPRYYFQYDLGFNLVEKEDSIQVECDYNRNLFDGDVVQCWAASYKALLEGVVRNPEQGISRLPMLNEQETRRLLAEGIKTSPAATIHELVENQVERTPNAIAATCDGRSLTYRDLDQKANRTASHLRTLGIGPDIVVGVCMERSPEMVMTLLAILKTGGAYVLIDPSSPREDLAHIARDTDMQIILADHKTTSCLPETSARVVLLNQNIAGNENDESASSLGSVGPDGLSCIVYKPWPDGRPKGVEITHRAVVNLLLSLKGQAVLVPQDVLLWLNPLSSHTEALELWLPLTMGAQISIAPDTTVLDPAALCRVMYEQGITVMLTTPSAWRLLLAFGWHGNPRLKALCTGEALRADLAERLAKICEEVWNVYGAAETLGCSMAGRVRTGEPVTLGHPINNTLVMVTDAQIEPVPVGVPGEIFISGAGLARSYRNLPSLTDEKFINALRGEENLGRFYRTGDLGRYLPNGRIEFIGRRDGQVRVRDGTIELGEIETILRGHAAVGDVALSFRGADPGVVAYVVPDKTDETPLSSNPTALVRELRRFVRNTLQEYIVPSRFVVLETLPRNADGTLNRMALPIPKDEDLEFEDYVAPRNKVEETLADLWKELLNLPKVSVKDSFFDLSGKSLLAVRLFVRIEQAFGRKLPLATLFQAPTIEQLALKLTAAHDTGSEWPSLVPIQPRGSKPPLFLVHGAGGNVLLYRALARHLEPDYPIYGLQSQGLDGKSRPLETFEEMAARYLLEIRKVQPHGPYLLGGYCLGGTIAYEMAQRLVTTGEKVSMVAMLDTYNFIRALKASFLSFLLQKLRFHWGNVIRLGPLTMWRYLMEKTRIAGDGGWAHIRTERPGSALDGGVARAESGVEASVQEINDHAGDIYNPKPYPGVLTLFKPHINYKFYPDPKMGWGDMALHGLDIVEMPMNPHAMLVEPYVQVLARELKTRLDLVVPQ